LGINALATAAVMRIRYRLPFRQVAQLFADLPGLKLSPGAVVKQIRRLSQWLAGQYDALNLMLRAAEVVHADETGWRLNGITHWLWCFATQELCYYLITKSRGSPVVKHILGTLFKGILICDFWGAYNKISALAKQRCFYHLFTELAKVDKHNACPQWKAFRKKLARLLKDAIRLFERKDPAQFDTFNRRKQRLYSRFEQFVQQDPSDKDARRLIKRLKRHKDELFTFLEYENVSPYNNHAEQQMRKPVLTRKVSQQNRSEQGAKTHAILMSLFRSAELQGKNPVETVLSLAKTTLGEEATPEQKLDLAA
jgi:hypothetical protein